MFVVELSVREIASYMANTSESWLDMLLVFVRFLFLSSRCRTDMMKHRLLWFRIGDIEDAFSVSSWSLVRL